MTKTCRSGAVLALASLLFAAAALFGQGMTLGPEDFKARRDKLCSMIPGGVAVLVNSGSGGGPNEEFYFLTGVETRGAALILVPESVAGKLPNPQDWKSTLYLPSRNPRAGVWDDVEPFPGEEAMKATGIDNTADLGSFQTALSRLAAITDLVYLSFRPVASSRPGGLPEMPLVETVKALLPGAAVRDLTPVFAAMRWTKSAKDVVMMKEACAITIEAFKESARVTKPGIWEYQIGSLCDHIFRWNGCSGSDFLIIGSGPNSCILHHGSNDRQAKAGDLMVIDIGADYRSFGTDLTRTIPVSGVYTAEQKKVYGVVLEAQKKAISMVKPGVTLAQLHKAAMDVIAGAGYGKYFIHFLSHTLNGGSPNQPTSLGLSAKLVPTSANLAADRPLEAGCMITIEPGIYIAEKGLGVRIEDDILVTPTGYEILTKDAPKEIDEIEKLMKEKPVHIID